MSDGLSDDERQQLRQLADADEPWSGAIDAALTALDEENGGDGR